MVVERKISAKTFAKRFELASRRRAFRASLKRELSKSIDQIGVERRKKERAWKRLQVQRMLEKGHTPKEIAKRVGVNRGVVTYVLGRSPEVRAKRKIAILRVNEATEQYRPFGDPKRHTTNGGYTYFPLKEKINGSAGTRRKKIK